MMAPPFLLHRICKIVLINVIALFATYSDKHDLMYTLHFKQFTEAGQIGLVMVDVEAPPVDKGIV